MIGTVISNLQIRNLSTEKTALAQGHIAGKQKHKDLNTENLMSPCPPFLTYAA